MFGSNAKTQANAFKQSAFLDAEYLKGFSPKMFNTALKKIFTSLSIIKDCKQGKTPCHGKIQACRCHFRTG